jgi:hypothetical protein
MESEGGLFGQWRAADRLAHRVEQALSKAALRSLQGDAPPPTQEQRQQAHDLRARADDLFRLAMEDMAARAATLRK